MRVHCCVVLQLVGLLFRIISPPVARVQRSTPDRLCRIRFNRWDWPGRGARGKQNNPKKRRLRWRAEVNAGPRRLRNETGLVRESWKRIDESYRVQDRGGVKTSERDMSGRPGRK